VAVVLKTLGGTVMKKAINQSTLFIVTNAITAILIIITIILVQLLFQAGVDYEKALEDRYDLTLNANRFMDGSASLTNEVRAFAATGDSRHFDNYWDEINNLKNRDIGVENMRTIGITIEEEAEIYAMASLSNQLVPLEDLSMQLTIEGNREMATELVFGSEYEMTIDKIKAHKITFLDILNKRTLGQAEIIRAGQNSLKEYVRISVIIVGLMQLVNVFIIMKTTISPIKKLQKDLMEIAGGNLSSKLDLKPNTSEIGMLADSIIKIKAILNQYIGDISGKLESMADGNMDFVVDIDYIGEFEPIKISLGHILDSLNETLSHMGTASVRVSDASIQISGGAQALAQGSTEQAASIEELSSSIAEISKKTKENSVMAGNAATLASDIKQSAEKGNRQMDEMMSAVRDINNASHSISKVIKVIDDIAFQTNILALNAAVEAARAGQHGKGFAVVAEEVRNLAAKSADAAKDTSGLIADSMEKAELGAAIAAETASSLAEIVSGIDKSNILINEIAKSSAEQSLGINQINTGIEHVSQVVQQNSATAQESAASAEAMSNESTMLAQITARFKTRDDRNQPSQLYLPSGDLI